MKKNATIWALLFLISGCSPKPDHFGPTQPVSFTSVHLSDSFWAPKIETNRTVSIPSAFHQCQINGRFDNFALAGQLISGEHKGDFPFDDTDVYKIIEGASYSLAVHYDAKLDHYLDSLITLIGSGQENDGYLTTCVTNQCERLRPWYGKGRWDRLNSHELYNSGHLYEAAVAHFQATGKKSLLEIAIKNANLVDQVFGPEEGKKKVPSGHPIIEMALVKLYRATNEERFLRLARFFIEETGKGTDGHRLNPYSQDHKPVIAQDEAVGHAVRLGYLYSGITDVASLLNDTALMSASRRVWDNVVSKKLYLTGGIGSRAQGEGFGENYELNNMTSYCETCASIANVYWNYRLFLNEPHAKYYDVLERTLYNGVISGVSLSGDKFFYDNPLESDSTHNREPWFGCACCPGNVTRFMASIPAYVYTVSEEAVFVNLFVSNEAQIPFNGDTLKLSQNTVYPWEGKVKILVDKASGKSFNLMVRIPGWARGEVVPSNLYRLASPENSAPVSFFLNGKEIKPTLINGYACIPKKWKEGDCIEMNLDMKPFAIIAHENVDADKGKIAFQRGPLVYCFEDKDNHNSLIFDTYIPKNASVLSNFNANRLGGIEVLTVPGIKVSKAENQLVEEPVSLEAIPYFAWNNRGPARMATWMPTAASLVYTGQPWGKEKEARVYASTDWVPGLNDGFDPHHSSDIDKPFFTWWNKHAPERWVEYRWEKPVKVSKVDVYWLHTDHYEGNYRMPASWKLEYKTKQGNWAPVKTSEAFTTLPNQYNTVHFDEVPCNALRISVEFQADNSAGILEWKVN